MAVKKALKFFVISICMALGFTESVCAQRLEDHPTLNLGFDVSIGYTRKNSPFGYGLGLDLVLNYELSDQLAVSTTVGYARLLTKDTSPIADYDFIPLRGTVKIFPISIPVYFSGNVGAGFGLQKGAKTSFIFGGGTGYKWTTGYDVGVKYEAYQLSKSSTAYQPLTGQFALVFTYFF